MKHNIMLLGVILLILSISASSFNLAQEGVSDPERSILCEKLDGDDNGSPDGECVMGFECIRRWPEWSPSLVGVCEGELDICCILTYTPSIKKYCPPGYYCECVGKKPSYCTEIGGTYIQESYCEDNYGEGCCKRWQIQPYGRKGCVDTIKLGNECNPIEQPELNGECKTKLRCIFSGGFSYQSKDCSQLGEEVCCVNSLNKIRWTAFMGSHS